MAQNRCDVLFEILIARARSSPEWLTRKDATSRKMSDTGHSIDKSSSLLSILKFSCKNNQLIRKPPHHLRVPLPRPAPLHLLPHQIEDDRERDDGDVR
jgi:hypothetical protein